LFQLGPTFIQLGPGLPPAKSGPVVLFIIIIIIIIIITIIIISLIRTNAA